MKYIQRLVKLYRCSRNSLVITEENVGDNIPIKKTTNLKSYEYPFRTDIYISHLKLSNKVKYSTRNNLENENS